VDVCKSSGNAIKHIHTINMPWLIGCEESGAVRDAMLARGIHAVSCDLCPSRSDRGEHLQMDIFDALSMRAWRGLIAFPPCTYLTCSAEWAYADGPYHQSVRPGTLVGADRRDARECAIRFVQRLWECGLDRVAIENPVGALSRVIGKPNQIIQPYNFGDDASKRTCLWLRGLPKLRPTGWVEPRIVNGAPRWGNQTDGGHNKLSPGDNRSRDRSVTWPGIASAMAEQWGTYAQCT